MRVFIGNDAITLDKRTFKGAGGEGAVHKVRHGTEIKGVKVYENPTKERAEKLLAFMRHKHTFNNRIIAPQELVFNSAGSVVGFTMSFIDGNFAEITKLSNKNFRKNFRVTTKDVALTFLDGVPTMNGQIHLQGFVIGDNSDTNSIRINNQMIFWDVDAWQFGKYPCPVATRDFVDPMLYGVDFSLRPVFTPGNDWYSFAVLLFRSLLLVHPYGGTHNKVNDQLERAVRKITVFDPNVIYPAIGIHPDILTDDMYNTFNGYFAKGLRQPFPEKVLNDYIDSLRECTTCGTYFPAIRGTCPVCSAKMMVVIQKPSASTKDMDIYEVIRVNGDILASFVVGYEVRVLVNDKGMITYHSKDLRNKAIPGTTKPLFKHTAGSRFEMSSDHLYVNVPGSNEILVYTLADGRLLGKLETALFSQVRRAAFRASGEYLFRIEDGELKYGKLTAGSLEESKLRDVVEDQTWFWVDQNSDTPYVFGLFQVLKQQMFWLAKDGKHYDVAIPQLETGESILDLTVRFSSQGVYLLRKTQLNGINYIRREMLDSGGKVVFTDRIKESQHPDPKIHGLAYSTGQVLHATDLGIKHENIQTGATKIFAGTKGYVDGGDALLRFGSSVLAVKSDRIIMVTPK